MTIHYIHAHDVIRQRLYEKAGIDYDYGKGKHFTKEQVYESFSCPEFDRRMDAKFAVGAYRYGLITEQKKRAKSYDHISSALQRLRYYEKTGDLDVLADVANLCKAEWIVPHHPNAHYGSEDDHGYYAPGRMT